MLTAITRDVSSGIGNCELTYLPRVGINLDLARAQHREYQKALADIGCKVSALPSEPDLPDSAFVEDVAVVLDEIAVIARLGVESRRAEAASVAQVLGQYRMLVTIQAPGTLEGGDVLRLDKTIYVGKSGRTNQVGIEQLEALTARFGYLVIPLELKDCLHLKSAVTQIAADALIMNPEWTSRVPFRGFELISVDQREPYGANALLVNGRVIYPVSFPRTRERLEGHGIRVAAVDVSELQKAEGALTCCSLIFEAG
ncbi:MAG: arginine deiminase family protein [Anaerolineales bacterium]